MLKKLAEKENIGREYISLDDLTVREMAKNDPKMFLQLHKPNLPISMAAAEESGLKMHFINQRIFIMMFAIWLLLLRIRVLSALRLPMLIIL